MNLEEHLLDIERKLWSNDAAFYENNLVEEAVLVFPETGVITRAVAVDAILAEIAEGRRWAEIEFNDVRSLRVSADAYVIIYRVAARWEHETDKNSALCSSLYVRRDATWRLAFHQQSRI